MIDQWWQMTKGDRSDDHKLYLVTYYSSHLLFLSGHYVRQSTEVIGNQLHLVGKWPMANCYIIEPWSWEVNLHGAPEEASMRDSEPHYLVYTEDQALVCVYETRACVIHTALCTHSQLCVCMHDCFHHTYGAHVLHEVLSVNGILFPFSDREKVCWCPEWEVNS